MHNVIRVHKNKKSVQVGRGGTRGKTSGRGTKGQNARAGHKNRPEMRDIIKKLPKMRGRGKNSNLSIQDKPVAINLGMISEKFENGEIVSRETLLAKGLIELSGGRLPAVKILADGDLTKKVSLKNLAFSQSAKQKIEKAGGTVPAVHIPAAKPVSVAKTAPVAKIEVPKAKAPSVRKPSKPDAK